MTTEVSDNTPLGDRMKRYEFGFRQHLPRRSYTLMRLDGRAFHTYLKDAEKPFDKGFVADMDVVAVTLCLEIQGAQFAYTQSDEISILVTDFQSLQSEPWFGGRLDKMVSISAALASAQLMSLRMDQPGLPQFDCRVWSMSDQIEVANYFVWRQRDAMRNSIQMLGQTYFTQDQLHCKNTDQIQEMLFQEHGVNWDTLDAGLKRGRLVVNTPRGWSRVAASRFLAQPGSSLAQLIPPLPSFSA